MREALTSVEVGLPRLASGKVREMFALGEDHLLLVATDRISAYDVIMAQGIPDKGHLLTAMSIFWFGLLSDVCPNHFLSSGIPEYHELSGRAMVVRRLEMLPIEFVVRGYLAGSGWKEYREAGSVCGIRLPAGLEESDRIPEPIFTPATKAVTGHDLNITEAEAAELCPPDLLKAAREAAIELYERAACHAEARGIILADTKFEFGVAEGEVILADEVLTPDSSRFWPADRWSPGSNPPSLDKQYLRDWLDGEGWDRSPPPPGLPDEVIARTRAGYIEAYEALTERRFRP